MYNYKLEIHRHTNDEYPAVFTLDSDLYAMDYDNRKGSELNEERAILNLVGEITVANSADVLDKIYNTFIFVGEDVENLQKSIVFSIITKDENETIYTLKKEAKKVHLSMNMRESNHDGAVDETPMFVKRLSIEF